MRKPQSRNGQKSVIKLGIFQVSLGYTVNPRLSATALINFTVILVRRLFEVPRFFGVRRLFQTSASQSTNIKRVKWVTY